MVESDWQSAIDPVAMLDCLRGRASDRKLRLFACAFCRHVWHGITFGRSRQAVETAERYADGLASDDELTRAWSLARQAASDFQVQILGGRRLTLRDGITIWEARMFFAADAAHVHRPFLIGRLQGYRRNEEFFHHGPRLLREVFGNPFRPVAFDPRWQTADVTALARGIYDERAFDRLPLLADALMDAGCADEEILSHCRSDGPHVRGCWVVDLVLGKE